MKQLCIRLDQKTYEKTKCRADDKALPIAQYIRRLVELGLRIEEMSEKKGEGNDQNNELFSDLGSSKMLWEKELSWTLEVRFLLRVLIGKLLLNKDEVDGNIIQQSKIHAEHFVAGLLNNQIKEN